MCIFNRNEDIQSMLYLGMALPKKNNPGMDEGVLQQLFEYSQMETQQSNSSVCFLKSDNFEQDKEELQQRLSCGEKIFVMSSYQTIGAGQNLQYKILKGKKVVQLGEFTEGDKRFLYKDFDALYLGNITNMTVNTYQDETITSHDLLQMLFQIEELYENGEMNYSEKDQMLPNISALMNTLMETDAKERVSKELLLEAIDDFEKDNIDSRECISEWKSKVAAETEMITKKAMKKILNMRTGIASKFNRFLHEKYGVWIDGELRKGEFEATYQIGNLLNIKYEYNEKDYLDGRTFVYYVGAKSKRLAYPNACCMRKVISLGEELEYEEALPLMAVEFVRNSQYTVLPFPFKYLREYIEQC